MLFLFTALFIFLRVYYAQASGGLKSLQAKMDEVKTADQKAVATVIAIKKTLEE